MKRIGFLAVALLALGAGSLSAGSLFGPTQGSCGTNPFNLVSNCGFETGDFTSWNVIAPSVVYTTVNAGTDTYGAHSGTYEVATGEFTLNPGDINQSFTTVTGDLYSVSFYLANDGTAGGTGPGDNASFAASFGTAQPGFSTGPAENPFGWTSESFLAFATGTTSTLDFASSNDPNFWYLDDVSVVNLSDPQLPPSSSVPEPATLLMLGSGLIVVARRLRKA